MNWKRQKKAEIERHKKRTNFISKFNEAKVPFKRQRKQNFSSNELNYVNDEHASKPGIIAIANRNNIT